MEELKGRCPIVRGARVLGLMTPGELRNPLARRHLPVQSGGSGGAATRVGWDLAFIRERAADLCLVHHVTGGDRRRPAVWGVPGSGAIIHLLDTSAFGSVPERWFSQLDPREPRIPSRYRLSVHAVLWTSRLAGVPLPAPIHAPVEDPSPVLGWMQAVLRRGDRPYLFGYVTSMLRLCAEAQASGLDLDGAEIGTGGEPVTAIRRLAMERAGARVFPRYAAIEAGLIADACRHPAEPDDMHLLDDLVAAIQPGPAGGADGLPPDALLVSSLRPSAPLLLINVSMGDQAVLAERACGCPLEELGWPTHLHSIRSFEKLTGTGATFLDVDVVGILERILPARFGGSALDYQLAEEAERRDGQPSVALVVHPRLGPLDVGELKQALLDALAGDGGAGPVMAAMWRAAGLPRVERRPPSATAAGKILHVHRPDGHQDGRETTGGQSPAHSATG